MENPIACVTLLFSGAYFIFEAYLSPDRFEMSTTKRRFYKFYGPFNLLGGLILYYQPIQHYILSHQF